jgi:phytanoyl-CoA hydroxylase
VCKILSFEDDPVLFEYAEDEKLLAAIRSLIGPQLMTISSNVFNKPPGVDGRHPLHQDLRYFALRPADKIVASWTALGPCRRANGCLAVIPGSHRGALYPHTDPDWEHVNRGFFAAADVDPAARIHLEMEPGDTLLFHPLLVHGSGHNRSDGFRRAISVHYASVDCERPDIARKRDPVVRRIPDRASTQ